MFYHFLYPLADQISFFNIFQYITVRSGGALMTSFFLCLLVGPKMIRTFRVWQSGSKTVRTDHPEGSVNSKAGTPSMGGLMILSTLLFSAFLWCDLSNVYIWLLMMVTIGFGALGFLDDYCTMRKKWKNGVPGRVRLLVQTSLSLIVAYVFIHFMGEGATNFYVPFFKDFVMTLPVAVFLLFACFVIVGSANSVNLTDGLDGLVSVPAAVAAGSFALLAYLVGRVDYTEYLHITYVPGASEIAVYLSALTGALLGFLWFNAPPARIFMGDTGSLPVGGILGATAVLLKQEVLLGIIGGIFVLETLSVIIQVTSFKLTGKRVFRMAPIHHHFEHKGWPEPTIVVRFWIIAIMLALVGLATLKIR